MSEFVARLERLQRKDTYLPLDDLMATVTNGRAVRVPLNGRTVGAVKSTAYLAALRRGYRSHARSDGDHVILWWEKAMRRRTRRPVIIQLREDAKGLSLTTRGTRRLTRVGTVLALAALATFQRIGRRSKR